MKLLQGFCEMCPNRAGPPLTGRGRICSVWDTVGDAVFEMSGLYGGFPALGAKLRVAQRAAGCTELLACASKTRPRTGQAGRALLDANADASCLRCIRPIGSRVLVRAHRDSFVAEAVMSLKVPLEFYRRDRSA